MKASASGRLHRTAIALVLLLALLFTSLVPGKTQTTLTGGDIAFTGYITGVLADSISFIVLRESGIGVNTTIQFTENGWLATGVGRTGEGIIEWKADRLVRYGEQVKIWVGSSTVGADKGTLKKVSGNFDLSLSGDQLFAFQGGWPNPNVLIAGLHYNRTAFTTESGWDAGIAPSANASVYPSALCAGCGVWLRNMAAATTEKTIHAYYKGAYDASPAVFRELLMHNENWETSFTNSVPGNPQWPLPPLITIPVNPEDTATPHVIAVATVMQEGLYKAGDEVNITAYFDKAVVVNASSGVPFLELNVGNVSSRAIYAAGSCSSAVTFLYPVQPGDTSTLLDYASVAAIQLNNGLIQGSNAKNADLLLPQPGGGASLAAQKIIRVDARPPVIMPYQSFMVDRFANVGDVIGTVKAKDEGPATSRLSGWKITQGNAGGAFAINDQTGVLAVANQDAIVESTPGYALVLTVNDGINTSQPTEVNILFNELPADTIVLTPNDLYENQPAATIAGFLKLKSGSAAAVFSLVAGNGDTDNALFTIDGNQLRTAEPLNYEVRSAYHVRVRATALAKNYDTSLVIKLLNVNEAPTIDAVPDQTICGNSAMQQLSLTGISAGPEAGQCVTVAATTDKDNFFAQLIVIRETDGTTFLRYKVKEGVNGDAIVTLTVKDTGGNMHGGVDSVTIRFSIKAKAARIITVLPDRIPELQAGETVLLTSTTDGVTGGVQWYWNEGPIPGATDGSYRVDHLHAGMYYCRLTDADNCSHQSNTVRVINKEEPLAILVYPNPAKGKVFITFSGQLDKYLTLLIFNSAGVEMQRQKIWHASSDQKDELNIAGYPAGVYIIDIISGQGEKIGHISFVISS